MVSVPYEITLLSNSFHNLIQYLMVSVPYEITLLSNSVVCCCLALTFQYLMKLHYSQTVSPMFISKPAFQYLMKLHYSQTLGVIGAVLNIVSVPYEITLLSNLK